VEVEHLPSKHSGFNPQYKKKDPHTVKGSDSRLKDQQKRLGQEDMREACFDSSLWKRKLLYKEAHPGAWLVAIGFRAETQGSLLLQSHTK
jgi:hypothetical protein